jgi:hypothetical protein
MAIRGTRQAQTNRSRVHANGPSTPRSSFLFTSPSIIRNRSRRTCDEIGRWTFRRRDADPGVLQRCADKGSRRRHNAYDTSKNFWELRNEHWLSIGEGIHLFHPTIAGYPHAKFPGVVVFSEIYQGELLSLPDLKLQALTEGCSYRPCCSVRQTDCWTRLHCRCPFFLP